MRTVLIEEHRLYRRISSVVLRWTENDDRNSWFLCPHLLKRSTCLADLTAIDWVAMLRSSRVLKKLATRIKEAEMLLAAEERKLCLIFQWLVHYWRTEQKLLQICTKRLLLTHFFNDFCCYWWITRRPQQKTPRTTPRLGSWPTSGTISLWKYVVVFQLIFFNVIFPFLANRFATPTETTPRTTPAAGVVTHQLGTLRQGRRVGARSPCHESTEAANRTEKRKRRDESTTATTTTSTTTTLPGRRAGRGRWRAPATGRGGRGSAAAAASGAGGVGSTAPRRPSAPQPPPRRRPGAPRRRRWRIPLDGTGRPIGGRVSGSAVAKSPSTPFRFFCLFRFPILFLFLFLFYFILFFISFTFEEESHWTYFIGGTSRNFREKKLSFFVRFEHFTVASSSFLFIFAVFWQIPCTKSFTFFVFLFSFFWCRSSFSRRNWIVFFIVSKTKNTASLNRYGLAVFFCFFFLFTKVFIECFFFTWIIFQFDSLASIFLFFFFPNFWIVYLLKKVPNFLTVSTQFIRHHFHLTMFNNVPATFFFIDFTWLPVFYSGKLLPRS